MNLSISSQESREEGRQEDRKGWGGFQSFPSLESAAAFSPLRGAYAGWEQGELRLLLLEGALLPVKSPAVKSTVLNAQHENALRDIHSRDVQFVTHCNHMVTPQIQYKDVCLVEKDVPVFLAQMTQFTKHLLEFCWAGVISLRRWDFRD